MLHRMNLHPGPFDMIASGKKTIELRLNDEKRSLINIGDRIEFSCREYRDRKLTAEVIALHRFPSFAELYRALPLDRCGYLPEELYSASPADMDLYYSVEKQRQYGVLGIELQMISDKTNL